MAEIIKKKVVYRHRRLDDNTVFYVGIGNKDRPYRKTYRNNHWHNIVNKYGYTIEIVVTDLSIADACELEELLIAEYGRRDLQSGPLCNMTDGGEGGFNQIPSLKTKLKQRNAKLGKTQTNEHKEKIREGLLRSDHPIRKKVINTKTKEVFKSIKDASLSSSDITYSALKAQLNGQNKNKSHFKLY